jgi:Tfp pilus assembly protein PilN
VTQVNLLPPEIRQRQTTRRRTGVVAAIGAVAVGALLVLWFLQGLRLHKLDDDLAAQNAKNAQLQAQVNSLQRFADQKTALEQRKLLLQSALVNTVRWSAILNDLSQKEPDAMWLTTMTGTASPPAAGVAAPAPGGELIGNIQFAGNAFDTNTIALWLTTLETVPGWVNPWMTGATKTTVGGTTVWTFSSTVDLDTRAARQGGTP